MINSLHRESKKAKTYHNQASIWFTYMDMWEQLQLSCIERNLAEISGHRLNI